MQLVLFFSKRNGNISQLISVMLSEGKPQLNHAIWSSVFLETSECWFDRPRQTPLPSFDVKASQTELPRPLILEDAFSVLSSPMINLSRGLDPIVPTEEDKNVHILLVSGHDHLEQLSKSRKTFHATMRKIYFPLCSPSLLAFETQKGEGLTSIAERKPCCWRRRRT